MTFKGLCRLIHLYKKSMLELGEGLEYARDNFQDMVGEGVDTWSDFLAQPEIGLTVREANSLIKLSNFIKRSTLHLEELNLATAKFAASKGILDPDLAEDMKHLSTKDFKERYADVKGDQEGKRTYTYMVMRRAQETGNLEKVHGIESEEVLEVFNNKINE